MYISWAVTWERVGVRRFASGEWWTTGSSVTGRASAYDQLILSNQQTLRLHPTNIPHLYAPILEVFTSLFRVFSYIKPVFCEPV